MPRPRKLAFPAAPQISVGDTTAHEEQKELLFPVTLDRPFNHSVTVEYETEPVSATSGDDYEPTRGTLTFAPGETSKTVSVPVIDDSIEDSGETVRLRLSNAEGAVIDRRHGRGLILNRDYGGEQTQGGGGGGGGGGDDDDDEGQEVTGTGGGGGPPSEVDYLGDRGLRRPRRRI